MSQQNSGRPLGRGERGAFILEMIRASMARPGAASDGSSTPVPLSPSPSQASATRSESVFSSPVNRAPRVTEMMHSDIEKESERRGQMSSMSRHGDRMTQLGHSFQQLNTGRDNRGGQREYKSSDSGVERGALYTSTDSGSETTPRAAGFDRGAASTDTEAGYKQQQQPSGPVYQQPQQRAAPPPQISSQEKPPVIKHGQSGKTIPLTANYIKLNLEPGTGVFEYDVQFSPVVDAQKLRFQLLGEMKGVLGTTKTFDGVTLYLPFQLPRQVTKHVTAHPGDGSRVEIVVTFRRKRALGECLHLYNVLLKRIMSVLKLARLGRHHYDPQAAKIIPQQKLEVWPGYVTAVDEYEGGIMLCCDSSSRILRTQSVLETMYEVSNNCKGDWQAAVKNTILGQVVLTRYNNRTYRVDDIDFNMTPRNTFKTRDGSELPFSDYYLQQYGLKIQDFSQPLLQSHIKMKQRDKQEVEQLVVLVPELCFLTGLTDEMRNNFTVMKDIAVYTRVTPNQRHYALKKYLNSVANNNEATKMLQEWGLTLADGTISIDGRVVEPEKIFFGQGCEAQTNEKADWTSQLTRSRVFQAVDLQNWVVIFSQRDNRYASDFEQTMLRVGPPMGMSVCKPMIIRLQDDRTDTYLRALREVADPQVQLVVIIFPTARDDRYSAVKRLCCADSPVPSQVINSRTLSRPDKLRSIVQKIALQINCKIGGSLWSIANPYKTCMVVGIDTYHEKLGRGKSVGGFVASLNSTFTRWYSEVSIEDSNVELINSLKVCFINALQRYFSHNNKFPERVFVFRDGVGDGQLQVVVDFEVEQFASCFKKIDPSFNPKFTFIVVQKRINTKLFAIGPRDLENPPPGTVVDHTVNRRNYYDFFLVSQSVRQGTVSPTHYVVIYDNSDIKPDHVQRFSYKLCHMYYNWPGTVKVPAPCQYAHKLAQLVGMHIKRVPHPKMAERLFFL